MAEHVLPISGYYSFMKRIEQMNAHAMRVGCPPVEVKVLGTERFYLDDPGDPLVDIGQRRSLAAYRIEVSGESPRINGWRFIGSMEHTGETGNFLKVVPGETLPERCRTNPNLCEHCNTARRRTETYVIAHENGETKQVGKNCLTEYVGSLPPDVLAAMIERSFMQTGSIGMDDWMCSGKGRRVAFPLDILTVTAAAVREHGWAPARESNPTSERVKNFLFPATPKDIRDAGIHVEDADRELAQRVLDWAKTFNPKSDFEHNLSVVAAQNEVKEDRINTLCAAVPAYLRVQERIQEAKIRHEKIRAEHGFQGGPAAHIGEVGKREVFELTVVSKFAKESNYGLTTIVKFLDKSGNEALWYASGEVPDEWIKVGETYNLAGTVKRHGEYLGAPSTILTRVNDPPKQSRSRQRKNDGVTLSAQSDEPQRTEEVGMGLGL